MLRKSLGKCLKPLSQTTILKTFYKMNLSLFSTDGVVPNGPKIKFFFRSSKDDKITEVEGIKGESVVDVSKKYDLDIEAACDQALACSTCHVIFDDETFDKLEEMKEEEEDLLDLAFSLTETSRLGCQIKVDEYLSGKTITIPSASRNLYVDGHKPEPH